MHLSSSKVTAWKNGSIPKYEILNAKESYFDVSIGTLFDGRYNNIKSLTSNERELLIKYSQLTDSDKNEALARVEELATRNTYKEQRIEPIFSKSEISKMNTYENRLLSAFRELSYEEQIELTVRAETIVEKFKAEENVG